MLERARVCRIENGVDHVGLPIMTETLISELRMWLRAAGVRKDGGRSLTGARELFWLAQDAKLDGHDIRRARLHFQRLPLRIGDGDLWRRLAAHLDPLARAAATHQFLAAVSKISPHWLARSPGVACGKFELFYRLTRVGCGWPQRGDVLDGGQVVEIKGCNGRLTHPTVTGLLHHQVSVDAFWRRSFVPNLTRGRPCLRSYEIIKPSFHGHYAEQFHHRHTDASAAMAEYLESMSLVSHGSGFAYAAAALAGPEAFGEYVRRAWLHAIYDSYVEEGSMDRLVVFGDGSAVKVIERAEDLRKLEIVSTVLRSGAADRLALRVN